MFIEGKDGHLVSAIKFLGPALVSQRAGPLRFYAQMPVRLPTAVARSIEMRACKVKT